MVGTVPAAAPPLATVRLTTAPDATGSPDDGLVAMTLPVEEPGDGIPEITPTVRPARCEGSGRCPLAQAHDVRYDDAVASSGLVVRVVRAGSKAREGNDHRPSQRRYHGARLSLPTTILSTRVWPCPVTNEGRQLPTHQRTGIPAPEDQP